MTISVCAKCGKPKAAKEQRKGDLCRECINAEGEEIRRVIRLYSPSYVKTAKEIAAMLGKNVKTIEGHIMRVRMEDELRDKRMRLQAA